MANTDLTTLNPQQKDAILKSIDHNVVLLAGAGSGKTHTLVKRTEYLITDLGVDPKNILMVTFTNKAANEIRERIAKITPFADEMWIGTFHKICIRLIKMFGHKLGVDNFTIMDQKDSRKLIKSLMSNFNTISTDKMNVKYFQTTISSFKNDLKTRADVRENPNVSDEMKIIYEQYLDKCWYRKTFDFDDLIIYGVLLLSTFEDVRDWVHENLKYIMVDECQDTNSAQFVLIKLITGDNNTMLIGDVNQSIYAFRNAKPRYLENYADNTPNTLKLKLEQNYRSTKNIIDAANSVVNNNEFGTKLQMFCDNGDGELIKIKKAKGEWEEGEWIAKEIISLTLWDDNPNYSEFAVIYRSNYQSNIIEKSLQEAGIPYNVFGSISFYERKEVRDLLAFCKTYVNPFDVASFERALDTFNGVGKKTIENIVELSSSNQITLHMALKEYIKNNATPRIKTQLEQFAKVLDTPATSLTKIVNTVFTETEYRSKVAVVNSDEAKDSISIMDQFLVETEHRDSVRKSDQTLVDDINDMELRSYAEGEEKKNLNSVKLMTAHASKGLEFGTVFVIGMEEEKFPNKNAILDDRIDNHETIEEERRMFYVAMTRAERRLYLTYSNQKSSRNADGEMSYSYTTRSRFLAEIPGEYTMDVV